MKLLVQASVICTALLSVTQIYAENITITGEVFDTTCALSGAEGTDNAYKDISVALASVSSKALGKAGDVTGLKPFTMKLTQDDASTACAMGGESANDKFANITLSSGTVEAGNTLVNTAEGAPATPEEGRVDVQVLTDTDQVVDFTNPAAQAHSTVSKEGDFPTVTYKAQYIRTGADAIYQKVQTQMTYQINYN